MRENRPSGSEGGGAKPIVSSYPYRHFAKRLSPAMRADISFTDCRPRVALAEPRSTPGYML